MGGNKHKTKSDWARVFALTLAALAVLFVAQSLTHTHANGQNEAACQVCQAAHVGAAPEAGTASLVTPLVVTGYVCSFVVTFHQEFLFHDSPSRAPPTA
jgi:hypothetical protein